MDIIIVTGMSGAGKTEAIKTLEELDYYCIDNLPPTLIYKFIELFSTSNVQNKKIAIATDARGGIFFNDLEKSLDELDSRDIKYNILFLEASDEVLINRYKEKRMTHPLAKEGSIVDGIKEERSLLMDIKRRANHTIDTTNFTVGTLGREIRKIILDGEEDRNISILITSFGFKEGILLDGDMVFDVRFLPNPYYIKELKEISGENKKTRDYVLKWPQSKIFLNKIEDLIEYLIPHYEIEGKTQLSIGIGCTGGFHRSVAITNELAKILSDNGHRVVTNHRDLNS